MSLRFIYGRAGSGKTRYCLDELTSKIERGASHPLVLLVPEQFTHQAERDLIALMGTGGVLGTHVLSFRRMAFRIFNEAGGIAYTHLHPAGKCMVLYRILDKMKDSLEVFSKSAHCQGFVNTVSDLITELKQHNVTPEMLGEAAEGLGEDSPLGSKLTELGSLYAAFEETIAARFRDGDDDLTLAAEKLDYTSLFDDGEIWLDGFDGFTPQEYKLIAKLIAKARRVNVSLCTDALEEYGDFDGTDVFFPVKRVCGRLSAIAKESGITVEPPVLLEGKPLFRFRNSPELAHLEGNLYSFPYRLYPEATGDIYLFSSINIFSEVEACARDIIRLCRDQGLRYRDIAVVVGDLQAYERIVEVIFGEYEIPCFLDRKLEITDHPLVRLILSMLDIFTENWSYETVFRYLKTGLTGVDRNSIDRLENYVLACGIRGNRWASDKDWDMIPGVLPDQRENQGREELLSEINQVRFAVSAPLLEFRRKTKGRKTAAQICGALYKFLCDIGVPERIQEYIDKFRENGQLTLAAEYSQVWNIVMEVFDQIAAVMGDETLGVERFSNILAVGFGEYRMGLIPASIDQVLVGSVERSRSHEVKAMYILGLNEGVFPGPGREEGVLSDVDREALNKAGIELASDTRMAAFEEQYLIYRALTAAGGYLRLSWPIADIEGRSMRPSMIVSRLRRLFPAISEDSNVILHEEEENSIGMVAGRAPSFRYAVAALGRSRETQEISPLWRQVYRWFAQREEWQNRCRLAWEAFRYRNIAGPVSRDKTALLYGSPAHSSVSRLEKYSSCPFAYYIQYGLGARERRIYRLKPPDVGTFMHEVIEKFSLYVAENHLSWRTLEREWCGERVSEIIEEILEKMHGSGISGSKRYTALAMRLKRVVTRSVWLIAEHIRRGSFEPVGYEMDFREGGAFPPITIELRSGDKVLLTGRIDRVDALRREEGTYIRIVDYKSGRKDFNLSDVAYGLQLQLMTYMDAIWEHGGMGVSPPLLPGGMLYFYVDDPIVKGTPESTQEEIETAIMKQLRMKGLLLADAKLIREMDHDIEGASLIIPARMNKGEVLGQSSAATLEELGLLRNHTKRLLQSLCEEIMKGNVPIRPYRKKNITSCRYCSFSAVCQFDTARRENTFRQLADRKDNAVWDRLKAESKGEEEG